MFEISIPFPLDSRYEGDMSVEDVAETAETEGSDLLAEKIRYSIIGVENLRSENRRLIKELKSDEFFVVFLRSCPSGDGRPPPAR